MLTCVYILWPSAKAQKNRSELAFDEDQDDLMDTLGFDSSKNTPKKKDTAFWSNKER